MAIIQISKIQQRRGRKNSGTGLPQLASAELGWAIDTQELYIGNGAVSEGAPEVGNTKILTEKDLVNIFDLARNYAYKPSTVVTGNSLEFPVERSIQQRLDDRVSIRAFGANGDNSDQTVQLQRALDQLYLNADRNQAESRVYLHIEPGEYLLSDTIYIPPFATIVGAGSEKTIFNISHTGPAFKTVDSDSDINTPSDGTQNTVDKQSRNLMIKGFSVKNVSQCFLLESCRDSVFDDISIHGVFSNGFNIINDNYAIKITAFSSSVTTKNLKFNNIKINKTAYGVHCDFDAKYNIWNQCVFDTCGYAFMFDDASGITGPSYNTIQNSIFDKIDASAIWIAAGEFNHSFNNKFFTVGESSTVYPVIQFDVENNTSTTDWFQRTDTLSDISNSQAYVPEIQGPSFKENQYTRNYQILNNSQTGYVDIFKLPADGKKGFTIEYFYISDTINIVRKGELVILVDPDNQTVSITDEYDYIGDSGRAQSFVFKAGLITQNAVDTTVVSMLNSILGDNSNLYYRIKTVN